VVLRVDANGARDHAHGKNSLDGQSEAPDEKAKRIAKYQTERHRDQQLLERFTDAMNFTFSGHEVVDSHQVEIFEATPRPDYVPKALKPRC
jgi:hypothetical protein